jgi:hypothetical protein
VKWIEMDRSSKRGKIPQQDWPSIIKRYEAGETLASIARTYDCSPPAISYIVSRSRAREAIAESAVSEGNGSEEPRLVKGQANDMSAVEVSLGEQAGGDTSVENVEAEASHPSEGSRTEHQQPQPRHAANDAADGADLRKEVVLREGNGAAERHDRVQRYVPPLNAGTPPPTFGPAAALPQNGEPRRTLHLSLSQDGPHHADPQQQDPPGPNMSGSGERLATRPSGNQLHSGNQADRHGPTQYAPGANGGPINMMTEPPRAKDGGAFIDQALRERVDGDIIAFLAAFDAALADDTVESRAGLREATDRLLRAGARTRIELERLEARMPLPPRDGHAAPTWRPR